jgi:hypothetical protein
MAGSMNFKVKRGLEVADSATIGGGLTVAGIKYPQQDGNVNDVIKTDGDGTLSFGKLSIGDLSDVSLASLTRGGLLLYDSGYEQFVVGNQLAQQDVNGGYF